jgi:hypothetical protein
MNSSDKDGQLPQNAMANAWREASIELGFEFVTPYTFVDQAGAKHTCSGLIVHFGGPKGTLVVSQYDEDPDADVAGAELGYYTSALSPFYYEKYDRDVFVETLVDWGWYGPDDKRPDWIS